jgi:hypothetical protein
VRVLHAWFLMTLAKALAERPDLDEAEAIIPVSTVTFGSACIDRT